MYTEENITVVGRDKPKPVAEAKTDDLNAKESKEPINKEKIQVAENIDVDKDKIDKNPLEEKKEVKADANLDNKKEVKTESKSDSAKGADKEDKENAFAVSFDDDKKEVVKTPEELENKQEAVSMSEESVLQFLQKEYPDAFAEVNSISEISKKEVFADPVLAFQKYHKETGRGIEDFYNLQKDWKQEAQEDVLREYYKMTSEGFSEEDIDDQMDIISVSEDYELENSEEDVKRRKIAFKKEYNKALKHLESKSKEYETPLGNAPTNENGQPQQLTEKQLAEAYKPYWEARDKTLSELEDFKFSIGIGEVKLPITKEQKEMIAEKSQTENSFFKSWITDKGLINTKQSVEDTAWAIPEIRKVLLAEAAKQIHAISIEDDSKKRRNVKLDKVPEKAKEVSRRGVQVFGGNDANQMGQPLIQKN
ncbi:MAG: hypothetical protein QM499_00880 [Flavobacteriaceae bacterium]